MRWEEMSWDKVRRAQMRWSVECEECSVKCEVWSVKCEVWSVKCEVWTVKCEVWTVKCEVWSVQWEACSVKCGVWSVECGVWSVECEAWSAKWSFKCDMWNRTPLSQSARTHGLGWRTAHASSIDEKGLIYIFKATSAPPRAGTTGRGHIKLFCTAFIAVQLHIMSHTLYGLETKKHTLCPTPECFPQFLNTPSVSMLIHVQTFTTSQPQYSLIGSNWI